MIKVCYELLIISKILLMSTSLSEKNELKILAPLSCELGIHI